MTPSEAMGAARLLAGCWRNGEHLDALPEACRPRTRGDGYAIQDQWEEEVGDRIAGWKIAATSEAGQKHIAVSGPIAGPIFAHRVRRDGAHVSLDNIGMRVAECEVVFTMAKRLAPRGSPYARDEVVAAIESVHPGIEVPDSRFVRFERVGEAQLIADCACMNEMVVGAPRVPARSQIDALPRLAVRAKLGTGAVHEGQGSNALGDPVEALVWLVNELSAHGRALDAGQFVTTGTCVTPIPVAPGERVDVEYGWLGQLGVLLV
jgi:2-keto-4-pentenoate hydratase